MNLPRDPNVWHEGHLDQAISERDNAFARYERSVDFNVREESDFLYAEYLRKDKRVNDIMNVVRPA